MSASNENDNEIKDKNGVVVGVGTPKPVAVKFTAEHDRMIREIHAAVTQVAALAEQVGPQVEKMASTGPLGLMLKSLIR